MTKDRVFCFLFGVFVSFILELLEAIGDILNYPQKLLFQKRFASLTRQILPYKRLREFSVKPRGYLKNLLVMGKNH